MHLLCPSFEQRLLLFECFVAESIAQDLALSLYHHDVRSWLRDYGIGLHTYAVVGVVCRDD
jgi:hypothetical protein